MLRIIIKLNKLYDNFYDYSKSDFSKVKQKTIVICPIHGEFTTTFDNHFNGKCGCSKCSGRYKYTTEEIKDKLIEIFGDKYDLTKIDYVNMHTPITLVCKEHGEFSKTPIELIYFKRGCSKCNGNTPLEKQIALLLKENNILFEEQKKFEWLGLLSLDFYLPEFNVAIECQGKQHFGKGGWSKSYNFEEQRERDERKWKLCQENNIKLLYFSNLIPDYEYFSKVFTDKK